MARPDLRQPGALRQLLISQGVPADADDEELLRASGAARHKLHITVLSAREASGQPLRPEQQAELAAYRARVEQYRMAWEIVSKQAPGAQVVKGWAIGDHYPRGWLRSAGDVDVVCPAGELWQAARALVDDGWEVEAFTLCPGGTGAALNVSDWCHVLIEVRKPSDSEYIDEPYGVELRTADVATSIRVRAKRLDGPALPPAVASVLALAAERWERPFRTRDLYDLAILTGQLDRTGLDELAGALTATMLWPQFRELSRLLRRSGLALGPDQPGSAAAAWRARMTRFGQAIAQWSNPLLVAGFLANSTVDNDLGALADRLAHAFQRRIGAWRLLRLGLPLFAVPLPATAAVAGQAPAGLTLERIDPHLIAHTPIGSFLLVAGSCPDAWLAEVSASR